MADVSGKLLPRNLAALRAGAEPGGLPQVAGNPASTLLQSGVGNCFPGLEFDMLFGDEAYKSFWARERRQLIRVDLFPPHLAGHIHHGSVEAERTLRTLARRVWPSNVHAS